MNVTAIMDTRSVSGPGKQLAALVPALAELGVALRPLLYQPQGVAENPFSDYLTSLQLPHDVVPYSGRWDQAMIEGTEYVIQDSGPQILQTHGYRPTAIATALKRRGMSRPWVAFFHGATTENLRTRAYHALDNLLMRRSDRIVVVSSSQVGRYLFSKKKVSVINNAILLRSGSSVEDGTPSPLPDSPHPKIAVIGRLSSEKGVDRFLQAVATLVVPFSAAIVGDGPDRMELEKLRDDLGLGDRVAFAGRLDPVDSAFAWSDLVVIPSRSEGMPNVLLEAIVHGKRVVATDVGNIREIMEGTALGQIVSSGAPEALGKAISAALSRPVDPEAAGDRDGVLRRYSVEERAAKHAALYEEVVAGIK